MEEIEKIVDYLFKSLYTDILKAYFVYTEQEQYIKYKLYFKRKYLEKLRIFQLVLNLQVLNRF